MSVPTNPPPTSSASATTPVGRTAIFLGLTVVIALAFFARARWPLALSFGFVDFEYGQTLHYADLLNSGARLYRDVFSQYGPLPILGYAAFATIAGNSAVAYVAFTSLVDVVALCLAACLLRRWFSDPAALAWVALALAGRLLRGPVTSPYPPFEAVFLLAAALCWQGPATRSLGRSGAIGVFLGLMQLAKFGGAFPVGFALVLADLFQALAERRPLKWRRWFSQLAATGAGFLLVELAFAAWLLARLPFAEARDILWPAYMLANYRSYAGADIVFSAWRGISFFASSQLPVLVSVGVAAACLLQWTKSRASAPARPQPGRFNLVRATAPGQAGLAVAFAAIFPTFLAIGYLPHLWTALHYLWIPVLAAIAGAIFLPRVAGIAAVFLLGGSVLSATVNPLLRGVTPPAPDAVPVRFPNGEELAVSPAQRALYDRVLGRLAGLVPDHSRPARCLVFEAAYGWAHYSGGAIRTDVPGFRHQWFMAGFVPPREEDRLLAALDHTDALLVDLRIPGAGADIHAPATWGRSNPFLSAATTRALFARCEPPEEIAPAIWLLKVRPSGKNS